MISIGTMHFDPNTFYSLQEIEEGLPGSLKLSTFLDRLNLRQNRAFRDYIWGWEILEASRKAGAFSASTTPAMPIRGRSGRSSGKDPMRRLRPDELRDTGN